jgi:diguanylate cyclase (GGDEF)-like protein
VESAVAARFLAVEPVSDSTTAAELVERMPRIETLTTYEPEQAAALATDVELRATELGLESLQVRAQLVKADAQFRSGQQESGVRAFRAINRWAKEHNDVYVLARSHRLMGAFFGVIGDDVAYLENALRAVELADESFPPLIRADHLMLLGLAQGKTGAFDEGRASYAAAEELAVRDAHYVFQGRIVNNLAYLEHQAGEHERALVASERLLQVLGRHGLPILPLYRDTLARAYLEVGRYDEAEAMVGDDLLASLDGGGQGGRVNEPDGLGELLLTLTEIQRRGGQHQRAAATAARCRAICDAMSLSGVARRLSLEKARLHAAAGDYREAYEQMEQYLREAEEGQNEARDARVRMLQAAFDSEEARKSSQLYREMALRDPLTALYNRRYVDQQLPVLLQSGDHAVVAVAFVDLDHFKRINDTLSHDTGDEVLRRIARLLEQAAEGLGFAARMGGEEFLLVLPGLDLDEALAAVEGLVSEIRAYDWAPVTGTLPVRASVGLAAGASGEVTQASLLAEADRHVYTAKESGRDRIVSGLLG